MLAKRALSAAVIILMGIGLVLAGGWVFTMGVSLILALAALEYADMFNKGGCALPKFLLAFLVMVLVISRHFSGGEIFSGVFSAAVFIIAFYHTLFFSKTEKTAGLDFAAMLSGLVFTGFLGSYLIRLRFLPDGLFWVIIAIAPAGISDIGAFFTGSALGRIRLAPQLSPNKSLEGYIGGVLTAVITGYVSALIAGVYNPAFTGMEGLLVGLAVGLSCPLGDLAKSIFKRQFNLKHTGKLIPGHGGVLDRIDTWLWAAPISYYLIILFLLK